MPSTLPSSTTIRLDVARVLGLEHVLDGSADRGGLVVGRHDDGEADVDGFADSMHWLVLQLFTVKYAWHRCHPECEALLSDDASRRLARRGGDTHGPK
ncbi:hypothetical protein GCM10025868_20080 [Angustibacter aerolatus]|uniref:Uncharacterized protein n=1 Tax=Angustibacter aerolatus TaxID=1162965 RepID=A0ABQ6JF11_9ACTN|nr:hypothetical protein GCM10025868_20080 [Angustibacter aerolatus]